jgi:cyclopropane fatty-acyl-phospholipid synthase-like methyltransferase
MGSPYVPTKEKQVNLILKELQPKKGKVFFELGCGDGRMVRKAAKDFGVLGFGFDVNPLLCFWARFLAKKEGLKNVVIERKNILDLSYKNVDYVYLFLLPEIIKKLQKKLEEELPKKAVVVSHGFAILGWEKKLFKKIDEKPFPTYFYRM